MPIRQDERHVSIILAEDSPTDAALIRRMLRRTALPAPSVRMVGSLAEAIASAQNVPPDVVVLDLNLRDAQGLETFVRFAAAHPEIPAVILTGQEDEELGIRAVREGAQDYLAKSEVTPALLERSIRFALERSRGEHSRRELQRLRSELQYARKIHESLRPCVSPEVQGWEITGECISASETGGDFYDFIHADGFWHLIVADVSGHGFGPALLAAKTQAYLRAAFRICDSATTAIRTVHAMLQEDLTHEFVTLFHLQLSEDGSEIRFLGAGHVGHVIRADGTTDELRPALPALAMRHSAPFPDLCPLKLDEGDLIVIASDGIVETMNADDEMFGWDRALETIRQTRHRCSTAIVDTLLTRVDEFNSRRHSRDDMTALVIRKWTDDDEF